MYLCRQRIGSMDVAAGFEDLPRKDWKLPDPKPNPVVLQILHGQVRMIGHLFGQTDNFQMSC